MNRSLGMGVAALFSLVLQLSDASAQGASAAIDVELLEPATGYSDTLGVYSATVAGHLGWSLGALMSASDDVLVFRDNDGGTLARVVQSRFGASLFGSIGIGRRFEVGVAVPIGFQNIGDGATVTGLYPNVGAAGLGDIRLVPRIALLDSHARLALGVVAPISLPTGDDDAFFGGSSATFTPTATLEYRADPKTTLLLNAGVRLRSKERVGQLEVGSQLSFRVGARRAINLASLPFAVSATIGGSVGLTDTDSEEIPVEALGALDYLGIDNMTFTAGLGTGLTKGYGTPDIRMVIGVKYRRPSKSGRRCTHGPEDFDGYQDDDACADPDNDGDGILDSADRCPNEAETINGDRDTDGCPEAAGSSAQSTKLEPPIVPPDPDGDGVRGEDDVCPDQAEDFDQFEDADGCPDPDNDGDGVTDANDKCPNRAEVFNGVDDSDGCPDSRVLIVKLIEFATSSDIIRKRSYRALNEIVALLKARPEILLVRIEGHTDSRGVPVKNLWLSRRRARSVRLYLIRSGIAAKRLQSRGYGQTRPVTDNGTAAGRARNRRVEFKILTMKGQPAKPSGAKK